MPSKQTNMLLSDFIPLILFTFYAIIINHHHHPPTLLHGPIISRLFSLIYHTFDATNPTLPLQSLDHLGICTMALSTPAACTLAQKGIATADLCPPYQAATALTLLTAIAEIALHAATRRTMVFRSPEHAVVALGLLGNAPVAWVAVSGAHGVITRLLCAASLGCFGFGYFVLKPTHHVLWHWAAAAGQAAGVAALVGAGE
jgi:hypothetical protein